MSKCPVCAASFPITQFVCEYCGHVETERVKKIDTDTIKEISFKDSMDVIKGNLNALQEIHVPTAGGNLLAILRIIVAIQTLGIALIFWKKPKGKFNKKEFNKLKAIVIRNIKLLKLSAKGSEQLQDRINITEKELTNLDRKIKSGILIRRVVTIVVIVAYLTLIFINRNNGSDVAVIPESTVVEGNLSENLEVVIEKYPVSYALNNEKDVKKISFYIKLKVKEEYKFTENERVNISMTLKTKSGKDIVYFPESKLNQRETERIVRALNRGSKREKAVSFYFIPKKKMSEVPIEIEKFSIHAETFTVDSIPDN
ncbi:MAG: hypothetical protein DRJ10_17070 [Bacteroidetes bacterium]|nr:MAG: hypothetical protein DRJ10_17070 [Bacteroidota bacterium]